VLLDAGLALRARTGRLVDVFRQRIVVPVRRHHDGQVVGFVGRAAPGAGPDTARYLNTPETVLYRKGSLLLGRAEQRDQLQAGVTPALVERPFDVLAIAGSGARLAAISPCGTALTAAHVDELRQVGGTCGAGSSVDTRCCVRRKSACVAPDNGLGQHARRANALPIEGGPR
jgi:DNA primase